MSDQPKALLAELSNLRDRTRSDRHGYWFPLLLFGILSFASMPLYQPLDMSSPPEPDYYSYLRHETGVVLPKIGYVDPLGMFNASHHRPVEHAFALGWYWVAVLVLGFLATVSWYRWRANRVGVETPTSSYVLATAVALAIPFVGHPLAVALDTHFPPFLMIMLWSVWVCIAVLAGALVVAALALHGRQVWHRVLAATSLLVAVVAAAVLIRTTFQGNGQFLVIAIGLLALAWTERSRLFGEIAAAFTVAMLVANIFDIGYVFHRLGIDEFTGQDVVLPGLVLVLGGVAGLIAQERVNHV